MARKTLPPVLDRILRLKVTLAGSRPPIWRTFELPAALTLADLHAVLQIVMEWQNSHLHQFIQGEQRYIPKYAADEGFDEENQDEEQVTLNKLFRRKGDKLFYEYDFGDSWIHEIKLEAIGTTEKGVRYPVCLDGAMAAPPEDSGGLYGYYDMLEILKDPEHEEYETYREWLPKKFDPEHFDVKKVNTELKKRIKIVRGWGKIPED
jgi:hypothetical protein